MNEEKKVKYGEIYFYDFGKHEGSIQNGLRPAVVIQDNKLNDHRGIQNGTWKDDRHAAAGAGADPGAAW